MNVGVQAKMLADDVVVAAIKEARGNHGVPHWASFWDVADEIDRLGVAWPHKVIREKLCRMVERGIIEGCDGRHNCRGDFHLGE